MTTNSIKTIIERNDAISLLLLGRINFNAGIQMMKTLRAQDRKRQSFAEEDISSQHEGDSREDEFAQYAASVQTLVPLDVSVNQVLASLILAYNIKGENLDFYKSNLRTPKMIVVSQMDWQADKQAQANLMVAQKMGITVAVDKFLNVIKGKQADKTASFVTEVQSAARADIKTLDDRHLIHLIEDAYKEPKWLEQLEDAAIRLYELAVKRLTDGKFADLPDEVVEFAKAALAKRGK